MSIDVSFTDASKPGPSGPITAWAWDFGDTGTSSAQNPTHTYATDGRYTVSLTVTGTSPDGTDNITRSVQVGVGGALTAAFTDSVVGLAVTFTDTSAAGPSGPITAWAWDFGDGGTSTSQNPVHTYGAAGTYTVTLTVTGTGPDGTDIAYGSVITSGGVDFFSATFISRPTTFAGTSAPHRKPFTTLAGLNAAITAAVAGDYIYYNGTGVLHVSSSSATAYRLASFRPTGPVSIDFGTRASGWGAATTANYVSFEYSGSGQFEAFVIQDCKNVYLYGGSLNSGIGGNAFRHFGNSDNIYWLDGYVEKAGQNALALQPVTHSGISSSITNCKYTFEAARYSMNPTYDRHGDKGSGFHGALLHGNSGHFDNNELYLYAHDPLRPGEISAGKTWPEGGGGSGIEIGSDQTGGPTSQDNNKYGILLVNSLMKCNGTNPGSTSKQTGGNGLNWWGSCILHNNEVVWEECRNCTGQVSHGTAGGWHTGGAGEIVVDHGRHSNTNQAYPLNNLSSSTDPYDRRWGIVYNDCT